VIIRVIQSGDIQALAELARITYAETFGHSMSATDLASQLKNTRSVDYFLEAVIRDTILGAFEGDMLIGYIQICDVTLSVEKVDGKSQQINAIYIRSDKQGKGVGKALMDAALQHSRLKDVRNIYIDVWDENVRAVKFYEDYGFKVVGKCDVVVDGSVIGKDLVLRRLN
jgi:ribosomal protein S18 acetylase RimI-like enzyme